MKLKILFFAVLLPLLSFSQGFKHVPGKIVLVNLDTVPATGSLNMDVNRVTVWDGGAWANDPEPLTILGQKVKCKCETIRDTTVHNEGSATCAHHWVFASHEEVNAPKYPRVTLPIYRPCPDNEITNFGRVCSKCLRHEIEHVAENWAVDHEKSKYRQLVEQSEKKQ